jgi:heme/copper-type cytochrome/quinol oxidase subunit 2
MSSRRIIKVALIVAGAFAALLITSSLASAQCAMCKNAITGSPNAARLAERFNFAIFVLLIPPVLIFCGFFIAVLKYRKDQGDAPPGRDGLKGLLRAWMNKLSIRRRRRERKRRDSALA